MPQPYKAGFTPKNNGRRKVGDVDPEGKAAFEAELKKVRAPAAARATPKPVAAPVPAPATVRTPTVMGVATILKNRGKQIDAEVDKASGV